MNMQRILRAISSMAPIAVVSGAILGGVMNANAGMPDGLEQIVYGDEKRLPVLVTVNDVQFGSLNTFATTPYLIWPAEESQAAPFEQNVAAMTGWLDQAAAALGYDGFEAKFTRRSKWVYNDVWNFELVRKGLTFFDARLEVHWEDDAFLGIVIHLPADIAEIEDRPVAALDDGTGWVYYPVRTAAKTCRVVPLEIHRADCGDRFEITIDAPDRTLHRIEFKPRQPIFGDDFEWVEYNVPLGTFPDQISVNHDGVVWFSQPSNDWVTSFDPDTEQFAQYTTGPPEASGPDGLIVGTADRVWTGLYYYGGLGLYDISSSSFTNYPAPYSNPAMAIPVETTDGKVWVTDHANNRISEFDPASGTFLQSLVMPSPSCWVVQGHEDPVRKQVYFTEYNTNALGRIDLGGSTVTDIPVSYGGPAFCVYSDDKVYYSLWSRDVLGVYDVITSQVTEYQFPVSGETGGPIWLTPDGKIVTGTRNRGYAMLYDPDTETVTAYMIPTAYPGLKDGITVAPDGTIWVAESLSANKIARLTFLSLPCPADVNFDEVVDIDDLFQVLSEWGPCEDCPEDINEDGVVDIDDIFEVLAAWGPCP